jgi:hypothetical protein
LGGGYKKKSAHSVRKQTFNVASCELDLAGLNKKQFIEYVTFFLNIIDSNIPRLLYNQAVAIVSAGELHGSC